MYILYIVSMCILIRCNIESDGAYSQFPEIVVWTTLMTESFPPLLLNLRLSTSKFYLAIVLASVFADVVTSFFFNYER